MQFNSFSMILRGAAYHLEHDCITIARCKWWQVWRPSLSAVVSPRAAPAAPRRSVNRSISPH